MDITINKFRIELNNLIQNYRERGIPAYIISGILAQEQMRIKEWELAELTLKVDKLVSHKEEVEDEQGIQQG